MKNLPQVDKVSSVADEKREDKRGGDQPKIKSQLVKRVGAATVRVAVEHRRELHRPRHEHLHVAGGQDQGCEVSPRRAEEGSVGGGWPHHCPGLRPGSATSAGCAGNPLNKITVVNIRARK